MTPRPWVDRFLDRIPTHLGEDECWEWQGCRNATNYGLIWAEGKSWTTHRLSFALHNGDLPAGVFICHHCDNPPCGNPRHLYAGDAASNTADKIRRDRMAIRLGTANVHARITEAVAASVRSEWESGRWTQRELAKRHNISQANAWKIIHRQTWRHVA